MLDNKNLYNASAEMPPEINDLKIIAFMRKYYTPVEVQINCPVKYLTV